MKKLFLLGGSRYLVSVIKTAHRLGLYVITCDYLPNNSAHKYADEYINISIMDKESVLKAAQEKKIDGIMSFACDPGVVTAAYVAEVMRLPFQASYNSTVILQDKGMFRQFLMENGFNCPYAKRYEHIEVALHDIDFFNWPVIVKPVDSAGSKGVSRVEKPENLLKAIDVALKFSHNGAFIIEDYLEFDGYHSSTDVFTIEGRLKFITYSDQKFDADADNPYVPAYIIWPSTMKYEYQQTLTAEIQRLMMLLNMRTGIYNIETCVAGGKPYIMEISPRGGGCKIAELQKLAYGIDLIEAEVRKAVGLPVGDIVQAECKGHWCEMVVHSKTGQSGILKNITMEQDIKKKYLKKIDLAVKEGDYIQPFTGANMALGDMFFCFGSREILDKVMSKSKEWIHINMKTS